MGKKRERMKREDSPRKEQGMKTTFLHLQTFSLRQTGTYSSNNRCHLPVARGDFCELFFLRLRTISAQNRCAVNSIMGCDNCLKVFHLPCLRQQPNRRLVNQICLNFGGKMSTFSQQAFISSTLVVRNHLLSAHRMRPGRI